MIKKIKPIYLLILLILIVVPLVFLLLSLFIKPSPRKTPSEAPIVTITPLPTPIPTLPPGVNELQIIRAAPIQSSQLAYLPVQSIELTFSDPILPEELKYNVEPFVETTVRQGSIPNALIIRPRSKWEDGETVVTILTTTTTKSGAKLLSSYIYRMISAIPPAPEGEGNY